MAAKKSGGLGRDFDFILDDNMPIAVQSPRKSKKRTPDSTSVTAEQSKTKNKMDSSDYDARSSERILNNNDGITVQSSNGAKAKSNARLATSTTKINNVEKTKLSKETSPKTTGTVAIKPQVTAQEQAATTKDNTLSRKEAVANLKRKINSTLKDEKIDEISTDNGESAQTPEIKDFHSPYVKIKPDKTQKEGNSYVKAKKRTWS